MQRREFLVSSVMGSVGAVVTRVSAARATRKILIAGGNYSTAFIRYMAELTGKTRPKLLLPPHGLRRIADGYSAGIRLRAAQRRAGVQKSFIASTSSRRAGKRCSCPLTASSAPAATRSISRRSGRRRASTSSFARHGIRASCSAARAPGRCAGSRKARRTRVRKNCLPSSASVSSKAATARTTTEPGRRPLYQKLIGSGQMKPGYACDNDAGIYFEDNDSEARRSTRPRRRCTT